MIFGGTPRRPDVTVAALVDRSLAGDRGAAAPVERYRALALTLERAEPRDRNRVVVVASALPGEGKTLTATNLAYTLSGSFGRRVLLIDGDLRRPRLHSMLAEGGTPESKLSPDDTTPVARALQYEFTRLSPTLMLASHPPGATIDAVNLLHSNDMRLLLDWARSRFHWVLIDSPPVALVPDAVILTEMADAALFVVLTDTTPYRVAAKAIASLGRQRVMGVVMNQVPASGEDSSLRYYEGYGSTPSPPAAGT